MTSPGNGSSATKEAAVFVTVGTTSFDALIEALDSQRVVESLRKRGYTSLTLQIGRGGYIPKNIDAINLDEPEDLPQNVSGGASKNTSSTFVCRYYRFKPTLDQDMRNAALIISHAGAGCIMESLRMKKPLVVVINESLMDNHQAELADAMESKGVLRKSTPADIAHVLAESDLESFDEYPARDPSLFPALLDREIYADS